MSTGALLQKPKEEASERFEPAKAGNDGGNDPVVFRCESCMGTAVRFANQSHTVRIDGDEVCPTPATALF
jgi:hypothetical protein